MVKKEGVSVFCQKVKKQFFLCLTLSSGWLLDESTNIRWTSLSTSYDNVNWNVPGKLYHLCLQGAMGSVVGDTFQKYSKNSQCLQHHVPFWPVTIDTAYLKVCPASLWAVEPSRSGALPFAWGCGQKTSKIENQFIRQGCRRFLTISDPIWDQPISDIFI